MWKKGVFVFSGKMESLGYLVFVEKWFNCILGEWSLGSLGEERVPYFLSAANNPRFAYLKGIILFRRVKGKSRRRFAGGGAQYFKRSSFIAIRF